MEEFFEQKIINATDFYDFINLKENPLFLSINEKNKNKNELLTTTWTYGLSFLSSQKENYIIVDSLGALAYELRKHEFIFDKNWDKRVKFIQALIYP